MGTSPQRQMRLRFALGKVSAPMAGLRVTPVALQPPGGVGGVFGCMLV